MSESSVAELAARIREREVSPVEVMDETIARIEERNPSLGALVYLGFDDAREAAAAAERALTDGAEVGPLHGVPTVMKDLFDFKPGWPVTFGGIPALRDHRVDFHCVFAERVERAGAIIVGKGNSPVLGFRGTCDNPLFGPTGNPFDTAKNSGGSSGGCAAAVADGLVPFAEGTDGGGSIRIPSSWCGVYGYKASFGRVPMVTRPNAFGGTDPFVFEGPITRTVEDAALAMEVLAGYDARDPYSLADAVDFRGALDTSIEGWRIGYTADYDVFPIDRRVAAVVDEAVRAFEEAGAHVEPFRLGLERDQRELSDLWCRIITPLNVAALHRLREDHGIDVLRDHADELPSQLHAWLEGDAEMTTLDRVRDGEMRSEVYDAFREAFERYDLIVGPTLCALPVDNRDDGNTAGPSEVEGVAVDELIGWCPTYLVNYTGNPAASVPAGLADGLPVGLQVIGRRYADADVLAASAALERVRPWHDSYRIPRERPL
jgi:amidase